MLSSEEISAFSRDGFVLRRGLLAPSELARVTAWVEALASAPEVPGGVMKYHEEALRLEGRPVLSRVEYFCGAHAGMRALITTGTTPRMVGQLLRDDAVLFKDKINFKAPGGAAFAPHQDAQAGWLEYGPLQLTCLLSIDATHAENGCLELAAGHHRRGLLGEPWKPLAGEALAGVEFSPRPTEPGDALFFDSFVPHRSGPNRSTQPRRVLYLTYNARRDGDHYEAYFAAKRAAFPPDCERLPGREYRYRV